VTSGTSPAVSLQRRLGPLDAAAVVVSNVIGGGIFFVPPIVAGLVPNPWAMLGVWLLGGLLALAGAMAYAELATLRPRAGSEYVYLREAFGPLAAFLTGWTSFVAGFSGAIAASAVGLADYLGRFIPAAADTTPLLALPLPFFSLVVSPKAIVAIAAIAALSWVHSRGLGPGRIVQNTLALLKTLGLVTFVALGFSLGRGDVVHLTGASAPVGWSGVLLALVPVMFTYSGWNAATYLAEEIRDPARNVPRALALGTGAVILIYLSLNAVYLYAMPPAELASVEGGLIDRASERLFAFGVADIVAAFTIVSIAASISAMTIAGPRVYFAMARDGLFLASAARVHPRFHTPSAAILAQAAWSAVLVLSGSLSQLVSYTGFAVVLFSGIAVAGLFVLRWRYPTEPRPFRSWGYPFAPGVFVLAAAVMLGNEVWQRPGPALAGLSIIASGVPVYIWYARKMAR
jgi:APA family basic amino acid/polyamine antiporter